MIFPIFRMQSSQCNLIFKVTVVDPRETVITWDTQKKSIFPFCWWKNWWTVQSPTNFVELQFRQETNEWGRWTVLSRPKNQAHQHKRIDDGLIGRWLITCLGLLLSSSFFSFASWLTINGAASGGWLLALLLAGALGGCLWQSAASGHQPHDTGRPS